MLSNTSSLRVFSRQIAGPLSRQSTGFRDKHSSRQVKRLFKKNPAARRIENKMGGKVIESPPEVTYQAILEPKMLPNGWNPPPPEGIEIPEYPFKISRTKNKPNDAVGFLPVYSEFRRDGARVTTRIKKVSGDRDAFLTALRAALQIPTVNGKDETIRLRTGGTIEVKGNRVMEVKQWLAGLGF
ncbi:unnamed protein product [Cylindrotheca closterium]|uniref:Large ribosomal subunit protein mL49 n=1 Tax=Cylindrotheca closterium TaxID=2856 RepID=A0AAD2CBP4_9STRA|nr:unnamed protein product [Cylindrotheca closterium]